MNNELARRYRRQNLLHTAILLTGMLVLLSLVGWIISGVHGIFLALATGLLLVLSAPRISTYFILTLYGARPVTTHQLAPLLEIITWLTQRSHLNQAPRLYYLPSSAMLAFSVGQKEDAAIAVSDGLLRALNIRELAAVLAHEISHIQNNDLWVMAVADVLSRLTSLMALTGYILLLLYIPLFLFQAQSIPWLLLLLLMTAPNLSALMQLALSRTREYNADLHAIRLTEDPAGLISALSKIDCYEKYWLEKILLPGVRVPTPSLLRTHPITEDRTRRLREMMQNNAHPFIHETVIHDDDAKPRRLRPRRRISGLWH
jgi:heat shock protein HtpX